MGFPQKLQEYRRTRELSQEGLASQLGVSRQSVSKWEQGLSFPETEKLIELSSMMGVSIDSLLKEKEDRAEILPPLQTEEADRPETQPPVQTSFVRRNALTILLACLLAVTVSALGLVLWQNRDDPTPPADDTLQQGETNPESEAAPSTEPATEPSDAEPAPTETEPVQTEPGFENKDLRELQSWFFDFARDYRLDYMPQFTQEEGPPTDSGEYLNWAYAINLDHWGENKGVMTKSYVEETVLLYYAVIPGQHRSHWKSWNFNTETETYTAYPGSLRSLPYYLLNSIEVDQGRYTVHATCYSSPYLVEPGEEDDRLRYALLDGSNTELTPISEVTITFHLDHIFYKPVFKAFAVSEYE